MTPDLRLVFWELTARCNLKCQHCRAEAQDSFAAGELTAEEVCAVADSIREAADPIVVLTGGEPLVRQDFFKIADHCVKRFSRVAMATNGTLIEDAMARRIAESGIQRVSISIDGANARTHDAFRGLPGSFEAAVRGIRALRGAGVSVQINVTITCHNDHETEALLELAQDLEADAFHVFMLVPVGCGAEITEDKRLSPERSEEILSWLVERTFALREKLHIKATCAPQYYRIMHEVARRNGIEVPRHGHGMQAVTRGCLAGSGVCFISRVGDVQPCGYLPLKAGNVRDKPLGQIWQESQLFEALRDPSKLTGKCGACGYRRLCQGCRARAYAETGDFLAAEPDCPYIPPKQAKSAAHETGS
jgi:heme b synthase